MKFILPLFVSIFCCTPLFGQNTGDRITEPLGLAVAWEPFESGKIGNGSVMNVIFSKEIWYKILNEMDYYPVIDSIEIDKKDIHFVLHSNRDTTLYVGQPRLSVRKKLSNEIRHILYISSIKYETRPLNVYVSTIRISFNYCLSDPLTNNILSAGHFSRNVRYANGEESETVNSILEAGIAKMLSENHPVVNKIIPGFELNDDHGALTLSFNAGTTLNLHLAWKDLTPDPRTMEGISIGNRFRGYPGFNLGTELKVSQNLGIGFSYNYMYLTATSPFIRVGSNDDPVYGVPEEENLKIITKEAYVSYRCPLQNENSFWLILRSSLIFSEYSISGKFSEWPHETFKAELDGSLGFGLHTGLEYRFKNTNNGIYLLIGGIIRSTAENAFSKGNSYYYKSEYFEYRDDTIDIKLGYFIDIPFYYYKN